MSEIHTLTTNPPSMNSANSYTGKFSK